MSPPSMPTSTEASQPRTLVNRVLLAFYAHLVASNFVWYGEHKGCCDGVKMDHFGLRCVDDNRSPDDLLLDSVLIIVSLTLGRRPVAIVRDPQSTHLELLIASKEAVSPTQRSDIERCFTLLAQIFPVDGPSGDARDGKAELLTHAYGTCSSEVVKIVSALAAGLQRALPQIDEDIEYYTTATDEDINDPDEEQEEDSDEEQEEDPEEVIKILTKSHRAITAVLAYGTAVDNDIRTALVPQLHAQLTEVLPILDSARLTEVLDRAILGGISLSLSRVSVLSRGLDNMMEGARTRKDLRALLARGVRCHWIDPAPVEALSITLDESSYKELRSLCPSLNDVPLQELVDRIVTKLGADGAYYPGTKIVHDASKNLATIELQATTHCEAALISVLADRDIEFTSYIACAPSTCYACHLLVDAMNEVTGSKRWQLGGYGGVVDCAWKFPSWPPQAYDGERIESIMVKKSDSALSETIQKYRRNAEPRSKPLYSVTLPEVVKKDWEEVRREVAQKGWKRR